MGSKGVSEAERRVPFVYLILFLNQFFIVWDQKGTTSSLCKIDFYLRIIT